MKTKVKVILMLVALASCCLGVFVWYTMDASEAGKTDLTGKASVESGKKKAASQKGKSSVRRGSKKHDKDVTARKIEKSTHTKPTFEIDSDDERLLTEEQRKVLTLLRTALDEDNFPTVLKLVQNMQNSSEWPDGIPVAIRKAAIEALAWFGIKGLPEIAGFLGDNNEEVLSDAIDAYESAMFEADGDAELSAIVLAACQAVKKAEAVESFLMQMNSMRNSVAVKTFIKLMDVGTDATKAALPEAIQMFTGEDNITTAKQLEAWYNDPSGDNKDDADDEEFYGPQNTGKEDGDQ